MGFLELNTNLLVELGGWAALKEARFLLQSDKVSNARREGHIVRARVQDADKIYEPVIILAERVSQVEVRCTCPQSRREGRVCSHALAAGLALLSPAAPPAIVASKSAAPSLPEKPPARAARAFKRWRVGEAPPGTPTIEITLLFPLNLPEALKQKSLRVILEGRRAGETGTLPWEALAPEINSGIAVSEEDAGALEALEAAAGMVAGITTVPTDKAACFFSELAGHPRIWLGKKQKIEIRAATERRKIRLQSRRNGALEMIMETPSVSCSGIELPLKGWIFDGQLLTENTTLPFGFTNGTRSIPHNQIPDFLTREWRVLEKQFDLIVPTGFEEFVLETGRPLIEADLEGALSGLTLNLNARYGDHVFSLGSKNDSGADSTYFPDALHLNRFWRRDFVLEKEAFAQAEVGGFRPIRRGAATLSIIHENQVARFLANTLPAWRQRWTVRFGSRLESALQQIDFAQPEFSLRAGSGEDWLNLDMRLAVEGRPVPLEPAEIQRWLQTGQSHTRTANNRVLLIPTEAWSEMREVLADCAVEQEPGRMRVGKNYAPFLAEALTAQGFHAREMSIVTVPPQIRERLDSQLWQQLRPYQIQGVEWLAGLAERKVNGLLADDMGLGKTIQALAFSSWLRASGKIKAPILVVCPTSLVVNWLREAARFVPHLQTLDLTGAGREERFAQLGQYDLLVTSYAILRRDVERYRMLDFSLVILDEAQHIKNRGSQNAQAAKVLRARHRLILTGTPLENSILDLWSLFDFLLPGYLGSAAEFRERYETPLSRALDVRTMGRLRQRVRPFFLRRTKEEVLPELPPKLEHLTPCELSAEQREVYRAILNQGRQDIFNRAGKAGQGRDPIAVLTTLLRLRQVCCHLDLLPEGESPRVWKEPSAKMERTFELIDEAIDGGHRVLLFSQFVRALHLLRDEARRRELRFAYLDGQTTERQAEVDRFQSDEGIPLFFISLKAGGTGLNLTGADTVIHFDPWWNPAVEEQATSRAHRLGQVRTVQAYKLIATGTVEEKIQNLQARKRDLFLAGVGGDDAFLESLTGDEMEELLSE